ncbi:MAG: glutamate 5-kinase [Nitrospinae bacterium]|nr:glutamate 5-kinase [Nitrospinota bacterium]
MQNRMKLLDGVKRIVVKIGSGVMAGADGGLSEDTLQRLTGDICALEADGRFEVIVVSSGAVMGGRKALALPAGKLSIPQKQAAAAVGQVKLMDMWKKHFSVRGRKVAQILLTHGDIEDSARYRNVRNTVTTLLDMKVIPVINENDSTAVDELKFGDNDTLAAKITSVVDADLLLILSDVDGLYESDPRKNPLAKIIPQVETIDEIVLALAGDSSSGSGTGGMRAKVRAAQVASDYGVPVWIIGGGTTGAIQDALRQGKGGTFFHPAQGMSAKQHRILHILKPRGEIVVDDGAKQALTGGKKSLLPSGIVAVRGDFEAGDVVVVVDGQGAPLIKGVVQYDHAEVDKIKGKKSSEIESILGYKKKDEVMHRDDTATYTLVSAGKAGE